MLDRTEGAIGEGATGETMGTGSDMSQLEERLEAADETLEGLRRQCEEVESDAAGLNAAKGSREVDDALARANPNHGGG